MPRFVEQILRILSQPLFVILGIIVMVIAVFAYNRPDATQTSINREIVTTPGLLPSKSAGILAGVAAQRKQTQQQALEIKALKAELTRLQNTKPPSYDDALGELQGTVLNLQAQVASMGAQSNQPVSAATPPMPPPPPPVSLRTILPSAAAALEAEKAKFPARFSKGIQMATGVGSEKAPKKPKGPYLPPQAFAKGRVIDGYTGIAAIETFPVTLSIDTAFSAPNGHSVPLTGCRLGATATPEELTARGRLTLTRLTCIAPNGQTLEQPITGYVTAFDNINGQLAEVFWHEREVLEKFGKAAIPVALVELIEAYNRTTDITSLTGVVTQSGSRVSDEVFGRIADIYLRKAERLASPIIWVGPDTPVSIYITEGADLSDFFGDNASTNQPINLSRRILQ